MDVLSLAIDCNEAPHTMGGIRIVTYYTAINLHLGRGKHPHCLWPTALPIALIHSIVQVEAIAKMHLYNNYN
jgi:hypothetical protein